MHPINDKQCEGNNDNLRSIPVRLLLNEPELNFWAD